MKTMQLITNETAATVIDDDALVDMFAQAGLSVAIVDHCDDASCPVCFAVAPAQAA